MSLERYLKPKFGAESAKQWPETSVIGGHIVMNVFVFTDLIKIDKINSSYKLNGLFNYFQKYVWSIPCILFVPAK